MKTRFLAYSLMSAFLMGTVSSEAQTTLSETEVNTIYNNVWGASKSRVSVHDPSIVVGYDHNGTITGEENDNKVYFIFGSHMAWAKSTDLINWTTFTNNINTNYKTIFAEPATWSALGSTNYDVSGNLWAPDVIWNKDMNKWCMYMSVNGDYWYSSIVLLTADDLDGNWTYQGEVIFSRINDKAKNDVVKTEVEKVTTETDLSRYAQNRNGNYTYSTNCIDPCVFYSEDGDLYMTYGSWYGGLYQIKLDKNTGFRDYTYTYTTVDTDPTNATEDIYMGKKVAGGNNVSGEASYIQYINGKYYLFVTYGGLAAAGGYNMRVFWSDSPEGPFKDMNDNSARYLSTNTGVGSINGNVGLRLMSYYQYQMMDLGNTAQGHNSAFVDTDGKAYLIYHTRFNDGSEGHQVRVHRLYNTKKGYLTAAPFEYNGTDYDATAINASDVLGYYNVIYHGYGTDYANLACATEKSIQLVEGGTVTGDYTGSWSVDGKYLTVTLGSESFDCVLSYEDYEGITYKALTFSGVCSNKSLWGYRLAAQGQIYDDKTALVYNVKNLTLPTTIYSGKKLTLKTTGDYNATITWDASQALNADGTVKTVTTNTNATIKATIKVGDYSYTTGISVIISPEDPMDMVTNPLEDYADIETFNNATPISDINTQTGLSISFYVDGLDSDWNKIGNSTDNNYVMYLSVLHLDGCDWYESVATASNGGAWDSYVNKKAFVTISYNPDGTISYYKNGKLILKYSADVTASYPSGSTNKVSDVCASVINYYKNGQFVFAPVSNVSISNIIVGYSQDFDPSTYKAFDYSAFAFYEDYDFNGSISSWTCPNGILSTQTDATYGVNIKVSPSGSGNRSAINTFSGVDGLIEYTIQFDIQALNGDVNQRSEAQIAITNTDNTTINNSATSNNYIFMLKAPQYLTGNDRTIWYVNNDENSSITIPEGSWARITCKVNTSTNQVETTIINRDTKEEIWSGTTETNGVATLKGLWLLVGRGNGYIAIDNIGVWDSNVDVETYDEFLYRIANEESSEISDSETTNEDQTTAVSELALTKAGYKIYPNPTVDKLMTTIAGKYQIFTANGHLVMSGIQDENGYIDISNLKSGVYIIRQGINTSKFVKQ
mgnify:FL=1